MVSVANKENCTGCYACSSICPVTAITMVSDSEGFWYPVVDYTKCIRCEMCINVCPIMETGLEDCSGDTVPQAYAAYSVDPQIRLQSSSGGLFTLLAETVIDYGGIVFGARFDEKFDVIHDYVEKVERLHELRGSKYVQSRIGDSFRQVQEFLQCGRLVMFTGTPCQIGGLKRYLGREYDHLICQDIICHGVSSPKVWEKYVRFRESAADSRIRGISFRQKDRGWRRFSLSFLFEDDTQYASSLQDDPYLKAFLANLCLRPSCYACHFKGIYRESDITLGDFWGIEYLAPAMDDDKGTSLVVLHTRKGHELFGCLETKAEVCPVNLEQATKCNRPMVSSVKVHPNRAAFFHALDRDNIDILIRKHCRDRFDVRLKQKLVLVAKYTLEKLGLLGKARRVRFRLRRQ